MSAALDDIRASVGAENCSKSCSRDGCSVDLMTDAPPARVIVDADKAFPAHGRKGKRCDFILFIDRGGAPLLAAPIELKSGRTDVSDAVRQLQGGADFADCFAPSNADCLPILFHGKGLHKKERENLNSDSAKITFRGRKRTIKTARCGHLRNLANVLFG